MYSPPLVAAAPQLVLNERFDDVVAKLKAVPSGFTVNVSFARGAAASRAVAVHVYTHQRFDRSLAGLTHVEVRFAVTVSTDCTRHERPSLHCFVWCILSPPRCTVCV